MIPPSKQENLSNHAENSEKMNLKEQKKQSLKSNHQCKEKSINTIHSKEQNAQLNQQYYSPLEILQKGSTIQKSSRNMNQVDEQLSNKFAHNLKSDKKEKNNITSPLNLQSSSLIGKSSPNNTMNVNNTDNKDIKKEQDSKQLTIEEKIDNLPMFEWTLTNQKAISGRFYQFFDGFFTTKLIQKEFDQIKIRFITLLQLTLIQFTFEKQILSDILKKQNYKRTSSEILFVRKCLKEVKFLQDLEQSLPEELILILCKFMSIEKYPQFYPLYKAGDFARKFYILLQGTIHILVPSFSQQAMNAHLSTTDNSEEVKEMIIDNQEGIQSKEVTLPSIQIDLEKLTEEQYIVQVIKQMNPGFDLRKILKSGEGFGEIALRTEGVRTASVVCREDAIFISITASTYQEIIEAHYEKIYQEKIDFLSNISIFKRWTSALLHEILLQCQIKSLRRGDVIYEEGDKNNYLYFVKQGEIEQTVEVENSTESSSQFIPSKLIKSNMIWESKAKQKRQKRCSLVILGPYQYFGDYEIFKKSKRIMRAVCYSNTEIYQLLKKDFFENLQFITMMKHIYRMFKEREKWYKGIIIKNLNTDQQIAKNITKQAQQQQQLQLQQQQQQQSQQQQSSQYQSQQQAINQSDLLEFDFKNKKSSQALLNSSLDIPSFVSPRPVKIKAEYQLNTTFLKKLNCVEKVIKLKKFVGKTMNLLDHISATKPISSISNKTIDFPSSTLNISDSNHRVDQYFASPGKMNSNKNIGMGDLTTISSLSTIKWNEEQQLQQQPSIVLKQDSKHKKSKSIQALASTLNLEKTARLNTPSITQKSIQTISHQIINTQRNIQIDQQLSNQTQNGSQASILFSPTKEKKNNISQKEIISRSVSNPSLINFQSNPSMSKNNSSILSVRKQDQPYFGMNSSLEDVNLKLYQLLKQLIGFKINQIAEQLTNDFVSIKSNLNEENLLFIRNQLDKQKKTLGKIKSENLFQHRYLCEKTGRYRIPDVFTESENKNHQHQTTFELSINKSSSPSKLFFEHQKEKSGSVERSVEERRDNSNQKSIETQTERQKQAHEHMKIYQFSISKNSHQLPFIKNRSKEPNFIQQLKRGKKIREDIIHDQEQKKISSKSYEQQFKILQISKN